MSCSRCHGMMVSIKLEDADSTAPPEPVLGWRCLLCGDIIDPLIHAHREGRQELSVDRARRRYAVSLLGAGGARRPATGR